MGKLFWVERNGVVFVTLVGVAFGCLVGIVRQNQGGLFVKAAEPARLVASTRATGSREAGSAATTEPVSTVPPIADASLSLANPWLWKKELAEYERQDATRRPEEGGIVFTGSSTVKMWKSQAKFQDLPVIWRGLGGSQSSDAVFFIDRTVLQYKPKVVVLLVGSNDIDSGRPAAMVAENIVRFSEMLRATLPKVKLLVVSIKMSPSRPERQNETKLANRMLKDRSAGAGFEFLDVSPVMEDETRKPRPHLYQKDQHHYNREGYARLTAMVEPKLREIWNQAG